MGKGKHTGQKTYENPDLENSIPSTWVSQLFIILSDEKNPEFAVLITDFFHHIFLS